jgi:GNAT superfamily N-acetyltransferase
MDTEIKRLAIDDYDEIIRIWAISGIPYDSRDRDIRERVALEMTRQHCAWFGFFVDARMVAVVIARYDGRRGWIERLAVDPDFRGDNIAGQLIAACEQWFSRFGEVVICCLVDDRNGPAMECILKAGYTCEPTIKYWSTDAEAEM